MFSKFCRARECLEKCGGAGLAPCKIHSMAFPTLFQVLLRALVSIVVQLKWPPALDDAIANYFPADPASLHSFPPCLLGMGIVENSTVRFGSVLGFASTVRFYHGFLNGLLMTFLGYETTQWNAWLNLPELESS